LANIRNLFVTLAGVLKLPAIWQVDEWHSRFPFQPDRLLPVRLAPDINTTASITEHQFYSQYNTEEKKFVSQIENPYLKPHQLLSSSAKVTNPGQLINRLCL